MVWSPKRAQACNVFKGGLILLTQPAFSKEIPNCLDKDTDYLVSVNTNKASKEDILNVLEVGSDPRVSSEYPSIFLRSGGMMILMKPSGRGTRIETKDEAQQTMANALAPLLSIEAVSVNCNDRVSF